MPTGFLKADYYGTPAFPLKKSNTSLSYDFELGVAPNYFDSFPIPKNKSLT